MIRIGISAHTRFYMFDLAHQMMRLGQDVRLYTGVPRFKIEDSLKPTAKVRARDVLFEHLRKRLPIALSPENSSWWGDRTLEKFGQWVGRTIADVDILDALAGTGLEAGRTLRRLGKPWVCNRGSTHIVTQQELLDHEHERWQLPKVNFSLAGLHRCHAEYEEAAAIVVPSHFNKRSFVDQGVPAEKVYVCPYGVNVKMFSPQKKADNKFRVLFVGGASVRKGVGYLLEAVRPLVMQGQVEVWFVGAITADAKSILDSFADIFIYKGIQSRAELAWYYSQGSVLVLPSIEEGLALVQAQALACGVPVIATTNTGAEDLFTDGVEGFIIPIRSPLAIREKVQYLLDCPQELQRMKEAALQRVQFLGGWDSYGEKCLAMYQDVLSKYPR